jgi:hypothetical protein
MDLVFIEGVAAVVSAIIVFCGSVFLLLAMVMGGRLAYFVTASVTLAFLLIMGVVWSINPLGPLGEAPSWSGVDAGPDAAQLDFAAATQYPEGPWQPIDTEDAAQAGQASELESASADYLQTAIDRGELDTFADAEDAAANTQLTRLLEQDGRTYGAVTLEPTEGAQGEETVVVMSYDPGNPLGPARMITLGTLVLLVAHLVGLSIVERRAREMAPTAI